MARPTKEGLEYFPLDVDIDQDEKLVVVIGKYGMQGFGIVIRLMMEIYKKGYFYHWSEKEQYVFAMKVVQDANFVNEIVDECIKWDFFDKEMFQTHRILTSKGIQKRFLFAVSRRKESEIKQQYNLLSEVNVDNNSINDNDIPLLEDITLTKSTQSKVKESKEKKRSSTPQKNRSFNTFFNQQADPRDKDIEFQKHVTAGNDPNTFEWND